MSTSKSFGLEATDVGVGVGRRMLLQDVSFTAGAGQLTAIVGINGIGKSTLLRALSGIARPVQGQVRIGEVDIHRVPPRRRARLLGFVGQNELPPGELRVAEFVALGRLPHSASWGWGGSHRDLQVRAALETLEISDLAEQMCDQLSGGQARRVVLARGLAQDTGILLLDEPTNHLDVHHQLHLLELLKTSGKTVVATIHDLDLAMAHFDSVVLLHDAGVAAVGPPGEVLVPAHVRAAFDVGSMLVHPPGARSEHLVIDSL